MIKLKKFILKSSILILGVGVLTPVFSANLLNNEVHATTEHHENTTLDESVLYQEEIMDASYGFQDSSISIMNTRTYNAYLTNRQVSDLVYELSWVTGVSGFLSAVTPAIPWAGYVLSVSFAAIGFQAAITAANLNRHNLGNGVVIITSLSNGSTVVRPRVGFGGGGPAPIVSSIEDEIN